MHQIIKEGKAEIRLPRADKVSSKMPVFYNPEMRLNRDISVTFLNSINEEKLNIGLPLEATGIRGIRFLKELPKGLIKRIEFNDIKRSAYKLIKENLRLNALKGRKIKVHNEDANIFLLNSKGFNYIDIDPFGSPNQFLDSGIKRLSSDGYLAVTCTDTASLSGTYPKTCLRKYWAIPRNDSNMHETGIRILIRKIQLIGSQYHKALFPVLSYSHKHYFRVYFKCENSKSLCNNINSQHGFVDSTGPMWLENLWEISLINKMIKNANDYLIELLELIKEEAEINVAGFFDIHEICEKYKIKNIPKNSAIIQEIKNQNYKACKTHFSDTGIRTNIKLRDFVRIISDYKSKIC